MRESGIAKLLLCSPLIRFWSQFRTWICYFPIWGVTRLPLFCYFPIWSGLSQDCPCLGRVQLWAKRSSTSFLFLSETSDSISNQKWENWVTSEITAESMMVGVFSIQATKSSTSWVYQANHVLPYSPPSCVPQFSFMEVLQLHKHSSYDVINGRWYVCFLL